MSPNQSSHYTVDIAILGSGFAGSILALILNKIGLSTILVDRATHPRFAIGESSTPIGNMILRDLAEKYGLPQLAPLSSYGTWRDHYPHLVNGRKRGFSYFQHERGNAFSTTANHSNELLVTASADDYRSDTQWLRADIDDFLIQEVKNANIPVLEGTLIHTLSHAPPGKKKIQQRAWRMEGNQSGRSVHIDAAFAVDATGPAGAIANYLKLPNESDQLLTRSHALFSHFDGLPTWHDVSSALGANTAEHPFFCDDSAIHQCIERGWLWMLRFVNGRVSAGFVLDGNYYRSRYSVPPEEAWESLLSNYPTLQQIFAGVQPATPPGKIYRTGRLQRLWGQAAGNTWALLPYTAGFIDPMYSTGIAHSLSGIERLVNILETHWGSEKLSLHLNGYSDKIIRELKLADLLIAGCYPCFGRFELLTSYVMLYFAAAITYEERRISAKKTQAYFPHDFLCVDEKPLVDTITRMHDLVMRICSSTPSEQDIIQFRETVRQAIEPYNTAGLFAPKIHNMYEYTAAKL